MHRPGTSPDCVKKLEFGSDPNPPPKMNPRRPAPAACPDPNVAVVSICYDGGSASMPIPRHWRQRRVSRIFRSRELVPTPGAPLSRAFGDVGRRLFVLRLFAWKYIFDGGWAGRVFWGFLASRMFRGWVLGCASATRFIGIKILAGSFRRRDGRVFFLPTLDPHFVLIEKSILTRARPRRRGLFLRHGVWALMFELKIL